MARNQVPAAGLSGMICIVEEELFNKCLFQQISLHELETELNRRNVKFSPTDTVQILISRVKLDILIKSDVLPAVRGTLEREISAFTKLLKHKTYKCCLAGCKFEADLHPSYVKHLEVHGTLSQKIVCQLKGCERELSNLAMLRTHIKTCHRKTRIGSVSVNQHQLVTQLVHIRCSLVSCQHQTVTSVADLKTHLKSHYRDKHEMVSCPFAGCNFESDVTGTWKSHFHRKHSSQQVEDLKAELVIGNEPMRAESDASSPFETSALHSNSLVPTSEDMEDASDDYAEDEEYITAGENDFDDEIFLKSLAIVFNTWANVVGIPYSTVQKIIGEVFRSYDMGVEVTKQRIRKLLLEEDLEISQVNEILRKVGQDDPFLKAKKQLENESKRLNFVKEAFEHTPPTTVRLNPTHEPKPETYQYVSLKRSLKQMLEDESFINQKTYDPYFAEDDVVKDIRDGKYFRENKFFNDHPDAIPILLFQDELEVCNPIGSAKSKHKFNATYYTVLDIQSAYRTRVKSIQLVSLVSSKLWKKYGNRKCNAELLADLLELESSGVKIEVPEVKIVKAGLCYFVGDNLGLHQLCELSASFSSGYICRVCQVKYKEVCKDHLLYESCKEGFSPEHFTKESYDTFADLAEVNGEASEETRGIKGHCIFNVLKSFHSVTGTPPCLGHDFFEGCFSYDVQHLIGFMINREKLLTAEDFNNRVKNFKLNQRDSKNRPNMFKTRKLNSKYEGSAGSLRVLSRIMIPILSSFLDRSKAGQILIKLAEISEMVTAPKLSDFEIEIQMQELIMEYLDLRVLAVDELKMPNPRPKHHYLSHYSENFRNYGPLIMCWGMRMESKHVYFKMVIRAAKNFRNVTKTCSERHQLAQVSYAYTGLFPRSRFEIPDDAVNVKVMKVATSDAFISKFLLTLNQDSLVLKQIRIYGTLYIPGNVIVIKKVSPGTLKAGILKVIAFYEGVVSFAVSSFIIQQNRYNLYVTTKKVSDFETVRYQDLHDYCPLQRHGTLDSFSISLHHFISEK